MAGIDIGSGHGGRRRSNHELPLIPFIDFLLCLVMFLLVTAVWSQMARLTADANVPGEADPHAAEEKTKELHVEMRGERRFVLAWKEGATVINTVDVPRLPVVVDGSVTYPALAKEAMLQWRASGAHQRPDDPRYDRAVLHTDNSIEFAEMVAVLDALSAVKRDAPDGSAQKRSAFHVALATD